jgi:class 3 adenylate cyclase
LYPWLGLIWLPALRAALEAQRAVAAPPHLADISHSRWASTCAPASRSQNGLLDYFGSTVNLAARLVPLSSGTDIVVSDTVVSDPEIDDLMSGGRVIVEPLQATLKGFEEERFQLWRLTARGRDLVKRGGA